MKNPLHTIVVLLLVFLVGCDGQDLKHKTAQEILKSKHLLEVFAEKIQFSPEHYTEIRQDTLLQSGINVKIKYFSDMDTTKSVLKVYKKDTLTVKHYYRAFNADVSVSAENEILFAQIINTSFINKQLHKTLTDYILTHIEVLQGADDSMQNTQLYLEFCKPERKNCKAYILKIADKNTFSIKETDSNYVRT